MRGSDRSFFGAEEAALGQAGHDCQEQVGAEFGRRHREQHSTANHDGNQLERNH